MTERLALGENRALPKLPVFPTPLTNEERRLVDLLEKDTEGTAAAFESFRKQSEPLTIEELKIQPLDHEEKWNVAIKTLDDRLSSPRAHRRPPSWLKTSRNIADNTE